MKVLLVDDHPLMLSALRSVIATIDDDIQVIAVDTAAGARAVLQQGAQPDLVLLDLALGDADGFEILVEFRACHPSLPVVVVSASDRASDVLHAIDLGAMGFVPKRTSYEELANALRKVMSGNIYVPTSMIGLPFSRTVTQDAEPVSAGRTLAGRATAEVGAFQPMRPVDSARGLLGMQPLPLARSANEAAAASPAFTGLGLTPRQAEVLSLLLQGLPNKMIARHLSVSVETVKDHVAAVLRALNVSSRTQAVLAVSQMKASGSKGPSLMASAVR